MSEASKPTCAVVIPNWNGAAFIERCLGSVLAALRQAGMPDAPVIVFDDASADDSVARMRRSFPNVTIIESCENIGFGAGVNTAMRAANVEWVFLLNNDLALATDFCEVLMRARDEITGRGEPLFAIGALTRDWETQEPNHACQNAIFKNGLLGQQPFDSATLAPSDFFQAGACIIHRARFLQLGGFAPFFHPGYWEDYDIAWAAKQAGWRVYYEPRAVAFHCGKGSMRKRYGAFQVSLFLRRNHLFFNWANLPLSMLIKHLASLPALILRDASTPEQACWGRALLSALPRLGAVLHLRASRPKNSAK